MKNSQSSHVLATNKRFYDSIASAYDDIDVRRKAKCSHSWIEVVLDRLFDSIQSSNATQPVFLDAGSGSGFLSYRAQRIFKNIILLDLSLNMLSRIEIPGAIRIQGDCASLPLQDESVDVIGAFATLHHLYDPKLFFREAYRILRVGGVLYTDHDIESCFIQQFKLPLKIYRSIFDHGKKYLKMCRELSRDDYSITEYHGDSGLDGAELSDYLRQLGFEVIEETYHWEGMGPVARIFEIFGLTKVLSGRGRAPVTRLMARKIG